MESEIPTSFHDYQGEYDGPIKDANEDGWSMHRFRLNIKGKSDGAIRLVIQRFGKFASLGKSVEGLEGEEDDDPATT